MNDVAALLEKLIMSKRQLLGLYLEYPPNRRNIVDDLGNEIDEMQRVLTTGNEKVIMEYCKRKGWYR